MIAQTVVLTTIVSVAIIPSNYLLNWCRSCSCGDNTITGDEEWDRRRGGSNLALLGRTMTIIRQHIYTIIIIPVIIIKQPINELTKSS